MTEPKEPTEWECNVIWKYHLSLETTMIAMPYGGTIRHVEVQNGLPCIWVEFLQWETNIKNRYENRYFKVFTTGEPIYRKTIKDYVGSFTLIEGAFVGHIYELEWSEVIKS